jgi:hypothetical protein
MAVARSEVIGQFMSKFFRSKLILTRVTGADREENLADVDTGDGAVGLAVGTTHSSLQSIGTSA